MRRWFSKRAAKGLNHFRRCGSNEVLAQLSLAVAMETRLMPNPRKWRGAIIPRAARARWLDVPQRYGAKCVRWGRCESPEVLSACCARRDSRLMPSLAHKLDSPASRRDPAQPCTRVTFSGRFLL